MDGMERMIQRFRTRIVEIDAVRFTGDNYDELAEWTGGNFAEIHEDDRPYTDDPEATGQVYDKLHSTWILVLAGQWIVKGVKGEFYPCDDETFHWKYEEVTAERPGCATQMKAATDHFYDDYYKEGHQ
jgi:hypothetical protein